MLNIYFKIIAMVSYGNCVLRGMADIFFVLNYCILESGYAILI